MFETVESCHRLRLLWVNKSWYLWACHTVCAASLLNLIDAKSCVTQVGKWGAAPSCLNNAKNLMLAWFASTNPFFTRRNFIFIQLVNFTPKHSIGVQFHHFQLSNFPTCALGCFPQSATSSESKSRYLDLPSVVLSTSECNSCFQICANISSFI